MVTHLETDVLRTFLAISETGSFTRASEIVNRTQSAVSMQMKKLEEVLGKPVFQKEGRSVTLTPDGNTLLSYARRMLELNDEALATITEPDVSGTVKIGMPDDYVASYLPMILERFAVTFPRVFVEVVVNTSSNLRNDLQTGAIDMALVTHRRGVDVNGLVIRQEPVRWVTSGRHETHLRDPLPLALFEPPCKFRDQALSGLEKMGRGYRIAYQSLSAMGINAAIDAGLAISVMASSCITSHMRVLTEADGFPKLEDARITLLVSPNEKTVAGARLARHIVETFREDRAAA